MKNYINSKGEILKTKPQEVIEIGDCYTGRITVSYKIIVFSEDVVVGTERFDDIPEHGKVLWAIFKHKGDSAEIRTIYEPEIDDI